MTERTSSSCTSNQRAGGLISGYVALVCADVAETVLLSVQSMYDNTKAKKKTKKLKKENIKQKKKFKTQTSMVLFLQVVSLVFFYGRLESSTYVVVNISIYFLLH